MYKVFKKINHENVRSWKWEGGRMAQNRVYLTGDMIPFRVIDLLCHLFPHFFIFCGTWEAASVIDEPGRVHFSPLHTAV